LIVLIIDARNFCLALLFAGSLSSGWNEIATPSRRGI
jgi:hypothetical protein